MRFERTYLVAGVVRLPRVNTYAAKDTSVALLELDYLKTLSRGAPLTACIFALLYSA